MCGTYAETDTNKVIRLVNEVGTKAVRAWESREREGKEILQASTEYQKREPLFRNVFLRHRRRVHHTTSAQSSKRLLTIAQPAATQRTTTTTVCIPVVSDRLVSSVHAASTTQPGLQVCGSILRTQTGSFRKNQLPGTLHNTKIQRNEYDQVFKDMVWLRKVFQKKLSCLVN